MDDRDELDWLAGLLEGEGAFLAGPPSRPNSPAIRLLMTDLDVVEHVARLLERRTQRSDRGRELGWRPSFWVTIQGAPAARWMRTLRPLMSPKRQAQIDRALAGAQEGRSATQEPALSLSALPARSDDDRSLAWLAGLLEGEGSFLTARSHGRDYPRISVTMCDEGIVRKTAVMLGAASVMRYSEARVLAKGWSPAYVVTTSGSRAATMMVALRMFMGERRRAQIDRALAAWHPIRLVPAPATCVVSGCGRPHRGRGLCHTHYMCWSRDRAVGKESDITPLR